MFALLITVLSVIGQLQTNGSIQPGAPVTIPHGTKIYTKLAGPVNTADLQPNFPIVFEVVAPYPNGDASFKGAQVVAFVSQVQHGSPTTRAGVGFIFDKVIFASGGSRRIYVTVDGPGVKKITQPAVSAPQAVNPVPGPSNLAGNPGGLGQPILWEASLTAQPFPPGNPNAAPAHDALGGFAHARQNGTDVTAPAGLPVTLVLARDLVAPH